MQDKLQWHPAFFAGIQIELAEDGENLVFENEHQLGTKPKEIDVLIVKKETGIPVKKNIGRIFRKHNIVEYKSPADYIGIDDYYKVYGYACFYKADTEKQDSIAVGEITITFVGMKYPRKLFRHLESIDGYAIQKQEEGIYILTGAVFPIQFIVTKELSRKENLWLYSLKDNMQDVQEAEELVHVYKSHRKSNLYESVMEVIVKANYNKFKEVNGYMCKALLEIMQPYIDEKVEEAKKEITDRVMEQGMKQGIERGMEQGMQQGIQQGIEQGIQQGIEQGIQQGEERLNSLNLKLLVNKRYDDLEEAARNKNFRDRLFMEFAI